MDKLWVYLAIATALWLALKTYRTLTSPLKSIPGPLYTLFTRLPLKLSIITGQRIHFIDNLHKDYGRIVRISPSEISISSLADFKEIHRVGTPFLKSTWYQEFVMGQAEPGIFAVRDVKQHAARRKLFARAFSKSELRRVWEGVVREKVRLAVARMKGELEGPTGDGKCDVLKWWTFLATDVAGHLMFGEDFGMLEGGVKNEYIHILESTMKGSGINAELPLVGFIGRHLPIASIRCMFRANDYLTEYGRKAVTNARSNSASSRNIFSGMLYEAEKGSSGEGGLSELDVVSEAGNLIVAGSDTTAVTLTYLVWAVLSRPQLQRDLENELLGLGESYDDAKLETLPLLNAVIKETLRLYGAAPGSLPRSVPEGGATLGGYFISEGMTVSTQSWTMHRDEDIFADADVFDVSRWLKDGNPAAQTAFSPFGAGARVCLGIHLAYMELRLAAAEFFRECRGVKLAPGTTPESMKPENYFLIAPAGHRCDIVRG
ncbi:cytochrome P450 [Aspergillus mulundensis]|uniref:Putative Cytochrome P450 n=1 Tax=Aspergillus mulundensis TaxID=1810919 RepID=A0A3D8RSB0_9EURO|nr:putative Cytochrome P450 [Aspergillus mulundensis]RDW76836.1 putative Cytochrome P450 [Aspergillus mulundensis]